MSIQIAVSSSADKLTQREQIDQVLARALASKQESLRVRLPFSLYDHDTTRGYIYVRDATWNLQLPLAQTNAETVEQLIHAIGSCIVAIAQHGSDQVEEALRGLGDSQ